MGQCKIFVEVRDDFRAIMNAIRPFSEHIKYVCFDANPDALRYLYYDGFRVSWDINVLPNYSEVTPTEFIETLRFDYLVVEEESLRTQLKQALERVAELEKVCT